MHPRSTALRLVLFFYHHKARLASRFPGDENRESETERDTCSPQLALHTHKIPNTPHCTNPHATKLLLPDV